MLNPDLYNLLKHLYGHVDIHSENEPPVLKFVSGSVLSGKNRKQFFRPKGGEQYGIKCPFCGKADKLYISHAYGTVAVPPNTREQVPCATSVFHCYTCEFNKNDRNKKNKFIMSLNSGNLGDIVIDPEVYREAEQAALNRRPEDNFPSCVPLDAPEAISARLYMESRNYNVEDLVTNWRVLYSTDPKYFGAPYIVFPIFNKGKLVSWQARYVGDDSDLRGCPKYSFDSTFKKTTVIYNMDRARHNMLGVLVEGIPAAIRVGPSHGIASFGKHPSDHQVKILRGMYATGTLVVIYDRDAIEATRKRIKFWKENRYFKRLINIEMPDERDPGDYTTVDIWNIINRRLKEPI